MTANGIAKTAAVVVIVGAALVATLAGTKLEQSVKPSEPAGRAKKLLVVLVNPDPDRRKQWEEIFAGELSLQGAAVTPSYRLFPELPKDRETARAMVAAEGFDSVLVANLVGQETKVKWKEGKTAFQAQYLGMDWWGGYWYTFKQVQVPGQFEDKSRARIKSDFWRLEGETDRLLWSGTSDSLDPKIAPQAGREVIVSVSKALVKAGLI